MDLLLERAPGAPVRWTTASADLLLNYEADAGMAPVAAWVAFGGATPEWALLDTGSEWSIVSAQTPNVLDDADAPIDELWLSSRLGDHRARVHRMSMRLIATEGNDVVLDGTVLVVDTWSGPNVIGFRGFLERVHFAIDAGAAPGDVPRIFFGPAGP